MNQTKQRLLTLLLICLTVLMTGCGSTRVVFVEKGSVARIGPNVEGRVYVPVNGEWVLSDDKVTIPEGYYVVPGPADEAEDN